MYHSYGTVYRVQHYGRSKLVVYKHECILPLSTFMPCTHDIHNSLREHSSCKCVKEHFIVSDLAPSLPQKAQVALPLPFHCHLDDNSSAQSVWFNMNRYTQVKVIRLWQGLTLKTQWLHVCMPQTHSSMTHLGRYTPTYDIATRRQVHDTPKPLNPNVDISNPSTLTCPL